MPDHKVALCLTFWGTARLFFQAVVPFYIPISSVCMRIPNSLHSCQYLLLSVFWIIVSVRCYFTAVLICISLIANDIDHFSRASWPFVYILWRNIYSYLLSIFSWVVFLLLSYRSSLHIVDSNPLLYICFVKFFSYFVGCLLFLDGVLEA